MLYWLAPPRLANRQGQWVMPMLQVLTSITRSTRRGRRDCQADTRAGGQPGREHPAGPGCPRNAPGAVSAPGGRFVLGSVCSGRGARSSAAPERNTSQTDY